MYILTIDNGTSSTKTVLWTADGVPVAEAEQGYALHRDGPLCAEIDGNIWWEAACATVRAVLTAGRVDAPAVGCVAVDGIGWTLLPVDAAAQPLAPAMIWLDRRAEAEAAWLRGLDGAAELVNLVANPIDSAYITPKLLWLRQHRPAIYDAAHQFLTASGFLVARLTGEFVCDYTQAYGYHFFDIRRERWDPATARLLGVPLEKMPPLRACTEVAGQVSPFEFFSAQVAHSAPGAGGLLFLPYMAGERTPLWSSTARGVFFGLSYATTRADILRAIMEGCAFAVYDNLKVAEGLGAGVEEWLGSGGATRSAEWCQIKADVTGIPFVVARRADGGEGGHTLGLFALAAQAAGLCDNPGTCVERLLPQRQVFAPSPERHRLYEDLFGVYLDVSRKLLADFDRLAAVTDRHTGRMAG